MKFLYAFGSSLAGGLATWDLTQNWHAAGMVGVAIFLFCCHMHRLHREALSK